MGGGKLKNP